MRFPIRLLFLSILCTIFYHLASAQTSELLSLERIYASNEFRQESLQPIQWIEDGAAYVTVENGNALTRWDSKTLEKSVYVPGVIVNGERINIESFSLSEDGSKVLIFTNSSRVWRSNTKGDYYVYDLNEKLLKKLGTQFEPSSLMFAKFSADNSQVAYVQKFNLYLEDFETGKVTQLTTDGTDKIINGTFDWAYEEEFGKRDGFAWSPDAKFISYWQIDASNIGTFYMINNTDSVYSRPIPLQYPKVGEEPAGAKIGLIDMDSKKPYGFQFLVVKKKIISLACNGSMKIYC
ncbi:DPP IV N-terminal domain-containing protein [Algoriphagus halophilus]|uniref:DPP IV N-terminal domain-containing protein n=1 Tax=Algoriphagus halophilus TaxID=226505 RepID=UPI00358E965C